MHQRPPNSGSIDDRERPTFTDQLTRWWFRGSLAGISISLLVHMVVLGIAAIWTIGVAQAGGSGDRGSGEIQLAVASETELAGLESAALELHRPNIADRA